MSDPVAWMTNDGRVAMDETKSGPMSNASKDAFCIPLYTGEEIERKDVAIAELVQAGRAVVDRWDSPLWKDMPHTGKYIYLLRTVTDKYDLTKTKGTK